VTDVKVSDLIMHSVEQKPIDFKDTFDTLLKDRLVSAIDAKRQEVAKNLFNPVSDEDDVEEYEDQEQDLESESEEE
jgi:hypothetical protein